MQKRKRAKSITFGKKEKKEPEKDILSAVPPKDEPVVDGVEKTSEKAETVERRTVPEKAVPEEVSAESSESEKKSDAEVATPSNEFITDSSPAPSTDASKESSGEPVTLGNEPSDQPGIVASNETPAPSASPDVSSPQSPAQGAQELSPTPPQSAFTIQGSPSPVAEEGTGGKKRFGVYFFVVAFLSFILGLGAMAAISFGGINIPFPGLPKNLPNFMAAKPTPTTAPTAAPVATPTEKAVNLTAYSITVLNGSGISGKAAEVQSDLEKAGFKVGKIGNADNNSYTKTQITVKESVDKAYVAKLQDELKKNFTLDTVSTVPGTSAAAPDVEVILGKETASN